jgi:hypothetical protein
MTNHVPGAADDAVISGAGITVTHSSGIDSVHSLAIQGVEVDLTNNSSLTVSNGLALTNGGLLKVGAANSRGFLGFANTQTVSSSDASGAILFLSTANNPNFVSLGAGATVTFGPGLLVHGGTAIFEAASAAGYINKGTVAGDAAGGTLSFTANFTNDVNGTATAQGGVLALGGTWTNSGTVKAENGGIMSTSTPTNFSGGTLTGGTWEVFNNSILRVIMSPGVVTNKATILLDGPNAHFYRDTGTSDALAPLASNPADSTFTVQNGSTFTTAGNFTNNGTLNVKAGSTFTVKGLLTNFDSGSGTLTGGTYNIAGTLHFNNAAIVTNAAAIVLDGAGSQIIDQSGNDALGPNLALNTAAGSFTIQNGANFTTAGNFENDGTLQLGNTSTFTVSGVDTDTGTLSVLAGGTLSLAGGGSASGAVSDAGTLSVAAGTTFTVSGAYSQTGTLQVPNTATVTLSGSFSNFASGTLTGGTYQIAGVFQFTGAAIATNAATIVLNGTGAQITDLLGKDALASTFASNQGSFSLLDGAAFTTAGDFENDGTLIVGAGSTFSVSGNFTQGSAATLDLQLGGTSAGQFGTLAVTGTATLAGTLLDTPVNGYQPMSGDTFTILTYGARSGDFATGPAGFDRNFDDVNGVMTLVAQ